MNAWNQPICRACYAAHSLGAGQSPHREPHKLLNTPGEPCLVCGEETTIYLRLDPKLTEGLLYAKPKDVAL